MVEKQKQKRLSQTKCPAASIEQALIIPRTLHDSFGGQETSPLLLAEACGMSPASSGWRTLTGAAAAYGFTVGGYNAKSISLTPVGEKCVAPMVEGEDVLALRSAVMKPSIFKEIYEQFNGHKLPKDDIACNILMHKGLQKNKAEHAWNILKDNARKAGILRVIKGNEYIFISDNFGDDTITLGAEENRDDEETFLSFPMKISLEKKESEVQEEQSSTAKPIVTNNKPNVFVSHGKGDSVIIKQLKELLTYGQLNPVVSVERETTAISVPEKVFTDMKSCEAGIIHINLEQNINENGIMQEGHLNENVLIEIGAAIALYGKKVILLCQKGIPLPSNLQGLYRCEYEGDQLDYSATMKLLKTMQELRDMM